MASSKRQSHKNKELSKQAGISKGTRYSIYAVVAIGAIVSAVWLTRGKPAGTTNAGRGSVNNVQSQIPSVPLRMEFLKEGILTFYNQKGDFIATIDIELAENNDERQLGLMYREHMEDGQGMFFIFPYDMMQSFWMKNTIIPLDMLFINSAQEIVTIQKNTTPYATDSYQSTKPAQYVLEVNAGYTDRLGIQEGYKVGWMRTN